MESETKTLVNISLTFPTIDREAVADIIAPLMITAVAAGGEALNISVQTFESDEE